MFVFLNGRKTMFPSPIGRLVGEKLRKPEPSNDPIESPPHGKLTLQTVPTKAPLPVLKLETSLKCGSFAWRSKEARRETFVFIFKRAVYVSKLPQNGTPQSSPLQLCTFSTLICWSLSSTRC